MNVRRKNYLRLVLLAALLLFAFPHPVRAGEAVRVPALANGMKS